MEITQSELAERCRAAGLKATPQRIAVLGAVSARFDHPSAESVLHLARAQLSTLSLATVYKALDALERAGLLAQVSLFETKRYDANLKPHHHLICEGCGQVQDLEDEALGPSLSQLEGAIPAPFQFRPREARLQIIGVCGACAALTTDNQGD